MQGLEMPHALTRFSVETHDGLGEQVVAGTHAAEIVARRFFEREIDVAELFVGAQKRPRAAVTRVDIRSVEPRVLAVLSGPRRHGMSTGVCRCARRRRGRHLAALLWS